jgi:hypothetical protein
MTLEPQTIWRPSSTGASQRSPQPTQVRYPGSRAFHQRSMPIPFGEATWTSDPNSSPSSPTRSKTTLAKLMASQFGLQREATRAPPSSAKSLYGEPPRASIPKTRDPLEKEANSRPPPPCGNSDSTGRSPIPPIHQTTQGPTNDSKHTPHIDAGATTGKAHTKQLVNVRMGQSRLADSTAQWFGSRRSEYVIALQATMAGQAGQAAHCRVWLFLIKGRRNRRLAAGVLPTVRAAPP